MKKITFVPSPQAFLELQAVMNDPLDELQFPALRHDLCHTACVYRTGRRSPWVPGVNPLEWKQQDRQRLRWNPIKGLLLSCKQIVFHVRSTSALFTLSEPKTVQRSPLMLDLNVQTGHKLKLWRAGRLLPLLPAGWQKKAGCTCRSRTLFPFLLSRRPSVKSSAGLWQLGQRWGRDTWMEHFTWSWQRYNVQTIRNEKIIFGSQSKNCGLMFTLQATRHKMTKLGQQHCCYAALKTCSWLNFINCLMYKMWQNCERLWEQHCLFCLTNCRLLVWQILWLWWGTTDLQDECTTLTFNEVRQVVLLHIFCSVVETDVIHLCGQEVPAVHCGSQQGVDTRRPSAWANTQTH